MNVQEDIDKFIKDSKRVLKVAKKPDRTEYIELAKISALGVAVIGVVGFVIVLIGSLIGL